jgi:hypothetical protein
MTDKTVFRVLIGESQGFHVDVEAADHGEAVETVRRRLKDPNDDLQPIEDPHAYSGYEIEDVAEIDRADADLE